MKISQSVTLLLFTPVLFGCFDSRKNTEELCASNSQLKCEELNMNDGLCRNPRTDLIWHRLDVLKNPSDMNKIKEYLLTKEYKKCLEVAAQIQPIEQAELKRMRYTALVNSGNNLQRLEDELKQYHTAESYYFLWSQIGDINSRRRFLQMEGTKEVETSELQYALATFYIDGNAIKTLKLLNHSVELATSPKQVKLDALESMASLYNQVKEKEKSYIWAKVSQYYGASIASDQNLYLLYGFDDDKKERLDDIAKDVISSINEGTYRRSVIPSNLN